MQIWRVFLWVSRESAKWNSLILTRARESDQTRECLFLKLGERWSEEVTWHKGTQSLSHLASSSLSLGNAVFLRCIGFYGVNVFQNLYHFSICSVFIVYLFVLAFCSTFFHLQHISICVFILDCCMWFWIGRNQNLVQSINLRLTCVSYAISIQCTLTPPLQKGLLIHFIQR